MYNSIKASLSYCLTVSSDFLELTCSSVQCVTIVLRSVTRRLDFLVSPSRYNCVCQDGWCYYPCFSDVPILCRAHIFQGGAGIH